MDILTLTLSHSVPCKTYLFPHILYGKYCIFVLCIGSIEFVNALLMNLFDKKKGLFAAVYFKDWLPWYMMDIFDVQQWIEIEEWEDLKRLVDDKRNLNEKIMVKFVNNVKIKSKIGKLCRFINRIKIPALESLDGIKPAQFKNEFIPFVADALCKYVQFR